jgi:hypothetical protein
MKLIDLIQNLDKERTEDKQFNIQPLFDEFNIERWNMKNEEYDLFYEHVHCYYVIKRYCTDSCVGLRFYYLDDEFICLSNQSGRKNNEEFEFASQEAYDKLEKFLIQFRFTQDKEELPKLDLNQEISELYDISFNGQLLSSFHEYGIHIETGEKIEIDYEWKYMKYMYSYSPETWQKIKDKNSDRIFEIKDLKFEIPLINKKEKN